MRGQNWGASGEPCFMVASDNYISNVVAGCGPAVCKILVHSVLRCFNSLGASVTWQMTCLGMKLSDLLDKYECDQNISCVCTFGHLTSVHSCRTCPDYVRVRVGELPVGILVMGLAI